MAKEFRRDFTVTKADDSRNLLIGWAVTSTDFGKDVVDKQDDIVEFGAILDASLEFAKGERSSLENHSGEPIGNIVFIMPIDSEIAKGLQLVSRFEGLVIGAQVSDEVMKSYKDGKLTGFSIAGAITDSE